MTYIDKKYIFKNVEVANTTELFEYIGSKLIEDGIVKETYVKALIAREAEYPTGLPLPIGVAIPHTDGSHVLQDLIVPVTLKHPVQFVEMGGDEEDKVEVQLAIFIIMSDGKGHLDILQNIIMAVQNEELIASLLTAMDVSEIEKILNENILSGGNK